MSDLEQELNEVERAMSAWRRLQAVLKLEGGQDWRAIHKACDEIERLTAERDECRRLLREAATYEQEFLPSEWCKRAASAAGGGDE
jgi:hypothetical protein